LNLATITKLPSTSRLKSPPSFFELAFSFAFSLFPFALFSTGSYTLESRLSLASLEHQASTKSSRPIPPQSVGIRQWDRRDPRSLPGADPKKRGFARPCLHLLPHSGISLWYVSLIRFLCLWISTGGSAFVSSVRTMGS
jgi:hypothetical protein